MYSKQIFLSIPLVRQIIYVLFQRPTNTAQEDHKMIIIAAAEDLARTHAHRTAGEQLLPLPMPFANAPKITGVFALMTSNMIASMVVNG